MTQPDFTKVERNGQKWMNDDSMISRVIKNFFDIELVLGKVEFGILESVSTDPNSPLRILDNADVAKLKGSFKSKFRNLQCAADGFVFYMEGQEVKMYEEARAFIKGK